MTALRDNRDVLDAQQLFGIIRRPVVLNAAQTPEYADIRYAGHEGGDFLFVRRIATRPRSSPQVDLLPTRLLPRSHRKAEGNTMKITDVTVDILQVPIARSYVAAGRQVSANWHVLARLTTSDGIQGHGYIVSPRDGLVAPVAQATRELGAHLLGMHVLEVEAAWARLARLGEWIGPGGLLHHAIAPLDIALWDAAGKSLGQPLYRLLGGYRDRVPAYASDGLWYSLSLDALAASAAACRERFYCDEIASRARSPSRGRGPPCARGQRGGRKACPHYGGCDRNLAIAAGDAHRAGAAGRRRSCGSKIRCITRMCPACHALLSVWMCPLPQGNTCTSWAIFGPCSSTRHGHCHHRPGAHWRHYPVAACCRLSACPPRPGVWACHPGNSRAFAGRHSQ